jgi:hypothetical protein
MVVAWLALSPALAVQVSLALAQSLPSAVVAVVDGPWREVGAGQLRFFGFHVYDARLWAQGERFDAARAFALGIRYSRRLSRDEIAGRSTGEIKKLVTVSEATLADWERRMRAIFPDVVPGDELAALHLPERGARFFLNGVALGEIDDPRFAQAFFAIWLDERTSAPALRAALLGERR